jgi:hypothetical protein
LINFLKNQKVFLKIINFHKHCLIFDF